MPCDKISLVKRLAVEKPRALGSETWRQHMQECPGCRAVRRGFARSLAVFKQVEGEFLDRFNVTPGWDRLAARLARECKPRRASSALRPAMWVAVAGMAIAAGGVGTWQLHSSPGPKPAPIVDLHPRHQHRLSEILQQSLPPAGPEVAARPAPARKNGSTGLRWVEFPMGAGKTAPGEPVAKTEPVAAAAPAGALGSQRSAAVVESRAPAAEGLADASETRPLPVVIHPEMFVRSGERIFVSRPMVGESPGFVFGNSGPSGLLRVTNGGAPGSSAFPLLNRTGR